MYNPDTFKPASPRSAANAEKEDAAMEESEEEPSQESNQQVTSLAARPEDSDYRVHCSNCGGKSMTEGSFKYHKSTKACGGIPVPCMNSIDCCPGMC